MGIFAAHDRFQWFVRLSFLAVGLFVSVYVVAVKDHGKPSASALDRAMELAELNNWGEAEVAFRKAGTIAAEKGDRVGLLYSRLGIIRSTAQKRNLVDLVTQLDDMLANEPLLKSVPRLRMFWLTIRGDFDGEMKSRSMRSDWEQVAQLSKELGDTKWQNRARAQIGFAAFYDGDIATCKKNLLTALLVATATGDIGEEVTLLYAMGLGLNSQKKHKEALVFLNRAVSLSLETPHAPYPFMMLIAKASALVHLGRDSEAAKILSEVEEGARQKGALIHEAAALTTAAEISLLQGDLTSSATTYRKVEELLTKGGYLRGLTQSQLALAGVYLKAHNLALAGDELNRATENMQASGEIENLPKQLQTLAELKTTEAKFVEADRIYQKAEAFIDAAIYSDPSVLDKTAWIKSTSELYVQHFALIADHLGNLSKAFAVIEQVRGRVTTDLLLGGSHASQTAKENEHAISEGRLALRNANTTDDIRRVNDRLFLLEQKRWITPEVDILKSAARSHVTLATVQRTLSGQAAILEYVLAEPQSYCLLITNKSARIVTLAGRKQIQDLATSYVASIKIRGPAIAKARALYKALLEPIGDAAQLPTLIVIRDGELHYLPFEGLVDAAGEYVCDHQVVSYLPSAQSFSLLAQREQHPEPQDRDLLAVGGVAYGTDRDQLRNLVTLRGGGQLKLGNLPTSGEEVRVAAEAFPGGHNKLLTGTGATKSAFKREPLGDYRIVHLAVHGVVESDRLDRAALVLLDDRKAGEDGLLQAPEIAQLSLHADLVVLSACDTATGELQGQEGIETLAHSFVLAGARSVISTLWAIDDNFSLALIRQFYRHYQSTNSAAESLALAKRDMLHEYGHDINPFYWAAFTFEGVPKGAISNHDNNGKQHDHSVSTNPPRNHPSY